jgi:hypothetical protein
MLPVDNETHSLFPEIVYLCKCCELEANFLWRQAKIYGKQRKAMHFYYVVQNRQVLEWTTYSPPRSLPRLVFTYLRAQRRHAGIRPNSATFHWRFC